jgi:DNA ligase-associated metallophosphoesterase
MSELGEGDLTIEVKGETLSLLPERAVFWNREKALLIADPHWGKAATFRAGGIPVPSGTTLEAIARLETIIDRTRAEKIYFLGDLLHAKAGRSQGMFDALFAWRQSRHDIEVVLVRGNHDRRAGDPPADLRFECVDAPWDKRPFILAHHPAADMNGYVIAGHVHPGIRLYGRGGLRERLPCFVFGRDYAILPAFGDFTGLGDIEPAEEQAIYVVAEDRVVRVTA